MKKGSQKLLRAFQVDQRSELSNLFHNDLTSLSVFLGVR
ncbi:hypothetical protein SAMN05421739_106120 [Pontibacter chinhatensis]|uniref:Uncharacterized protein n=1 Tax=Pontibacter chinhatensis TaxID=1436961 RepID=A0A1I2XLC2_9BACT|nr:hypothetical protein SAMN05421739_106120 [Pontibacter chinhatensis]